MKSLYHIALTLFVCLSFVLTKAQTYPLSDVGFRTCLSNSFPGILDAQNELIISEALNHDTLPCNNHNINTIDGLQYFTNLKVVYLSFNNLETVNEVSNLTNLQELYLDKNKINQAPNLSNLNNLVALRLDENKLTTPPILPIANNLRILDLFDNLLAELPNFSQNTNIEWLSVARNLNLRSIEGVQQLTALKELSAYLCNLTELPNLSSLTNLETLNIGYNKLTALPSLSTNTSLKLIFANNNSLTAFSDLSMLPNLERVRLYNNYLSFEDFLPLLVDTGYANIYKIEPQFTFPNPLSSVYLENDSISLQTGIASTVPEATYTWYFNGLELLQSQSDSLFIDSAAFEHAGYYSFTVTHPSFPSLTLYSDTTTISIENCINKIGFEYDIVEATCKKTGTISIYPKNQPKEISSYSLTSKTTGKTIVSENGVFEGLNQPNYVFNATTGQRCVKTIGTIELPIQKCDEAFFTPNGDGEDDSFYFQQRGTAKIYNKWGQLVKELHVPTEWDGRLKNSSTIPPGYYTVEFNDGEEVIHLSIIY